MAGYLIGEEGPLSGFIISFYIGEEWVLGRDPDESTIVLEDPMVSRKHVICTLTAEGYLLENLSSVNPATQNGKVITEAVLLREGDIIQIGSTFFRFTEKAPASLEEIEKEAPPLPSGVFEEGEDLSMISFSGNGDTRWLLKVISGPNAGAEFGLHKSSAYTLGKDPNLCDVVFQDLSVSRQHARIVVDENDVVSIEDLGSRNGVLVNCELITEKRKLSSQDLVALGTTSFLVIDREKIHETIVSPPQVALRPEPEKKEEAAPALVKEEVRDWKEMVIPKKHLVLAGVFGVALIASVAAMFALFRTEEVKVSTKNESEAVQEAIKNYPDIQFTFNQNTGKLFLVGHVLTPVEKQELMYTLNGLPFVENIDDNIVVDEYVWQNMNALLMTNPDWQGISIHSPSPGRFVLRGYLQSLEQAQALSDYININFPYLDRLDNQVVVESNLMTQIQSMLIEKGFSAVTFQLSNGEIVLAGRVEAQHSSEFNGLVDHLKSLRGVRMVKNFVVYTTPDSSRVDVSSKYQVTGFSKRDESDFYVVVNGRILSIGDTLDGMMITAIHPNMVFLEKDGVKFRINYNLQ